MPSEVWGYKEADRVEVRLLSKSAAVSAKWHMATVVRLTPQRTLMVLLDERHPPPDGGNPGGTREVTRPDMIRMWKPPKTADDIEAFLNGG